MQHKKQYLWALVGKFLPQFVYLLTTMVLARFLTPDDFGAIGVLSIFFIVANTLMDSGLGGSLVKEKEISDIDCSTIAVFNIVVSHTLYLLLFLFSGIIERHYEVDGLSLIVKTLCLIFVINSWGLVPHALLTRSLRFRTKTIIGLVSVAISAIIAIVMALMGCGVWSLVAYQLSGGVVSVIMAMVAIHYRISFRFSWYSLKRLFSFGVLTTLTTTIDTIYENLTVNIFGKYLSIQQAGYLYQAKRIEEVPSQSVVITISNVSFPVLTKLRNETNKFVDECKSIFKTVLLALLPPLCCLSLFSKPIILLVFGNQWEAAAPYLSLLVVAGIFKVAETLNRTFIKSTTQVGKLFIYTIIKRSIGIGILIGCMFINPSFVLEGYIISAFIGFIVNAVLFSKVSSMRFFEQLLLFLKVLLPSLVFYGIMFIFMRVVEVLTVQILAALFLMVIYYLWILPKFGFNIKNWVGKVKNKD